MEGDWRCYNNAPTIINGLLYVPPNVRQWIPQYNQGSHNQRLGPTVTQSEVPELAHLEGTFKLRDAQYPHGQGDLLAGGWLFWTTVVKIPSFDEYTRTENLKVSFASLRRHTNKLLLGIPQLIYHTARKDSKGKRTFHDGQNSEREGCADGWVFKAQEVDMREFCDLNGPKAVACFQRVADRQDREPQYIRGASNPAHVHLVTADGGESRIGGSYILPYRAGKIKRLQPTGDIWVVGFKREDGETFNFPLSQLAAVTAGTDVWLDPPRFADVAYELSKHILISPGRWQMALVYPAAYCDGRLRI